MGFTAVNEVELLVHKRLNTKAAGWGFVDKNA